MSSKTLCALVRIAVISVMVCGVVAMGVIIPYIGKEIANENPETVHFFYPWLIFLWVAALPCFTILVLAWKTSTAIKKEQVFTQRTARWTQISALLLFGDAAFFFFGNIIYAALGMNFPAMMLLALFIVIFALSLGLVAAVLSRYLAKAAKLQEEVDSTI